MKKAVAGAAAFLLNGSWCMVAGKSDGFYNVSAEIKHIAAAPYLAIFQRLGLSDTVRQAVSLDILDERIDFFQGFLSGSCHCRYSSHTGIADKTDSVKRIL